ncbi:MAG: TetR/AcrR family transcriptional regulator [Lentisphaerae bacterium]|nr:TetR/AcrR family transcriptional regulator [Lentisphaerota bacterium]
MPRPVSICDNAILDAARKIFLKRGFSATTAQIARAARVSEGSLFKHFRSKRDLFIAAMEVETQAQVWRDRLVQAAGVDDIQATLEFVGDRLLKRLQIILPRMMMVSATGVTIVGAGRSGSPPPPLEHMRLVARYFRAEIKAGRLVMDQPEAQAHAFIGALSHYVTCENLFGFHPASPRTYVRTVVGTILRATQTDAGGDRGKPARRRTPSSSKETRP